MVIKMKRSELEIKIEILRLCKTPRKTTEVMYKCNLNHIKKKEHLETLTNNAMIEKTKLGYTTTNKGKTILEKWNNLIPAMRELP